MNRFIVILTVGMVLMLLSGCQDEQQNGSKVWGDGNPPADYVQMFGDDNIARLNFVQNEFINRHNQVLIELQTRIQALEMENPAELAKRVRDLEKPNDPTDQE